MIRVQWREAGGPAVKPPARQGFGTKLIERSTAHELKGIARLGCAPEGLRCDLIFPWVELDPAGHLDGWLRLWDSELRVWPDCGFSSWKTRC